MFALVCQSFSRYMTKPKELFILSHLQILQIHGIHYLLRNKHRCIHMQLSISTTSRSNIPSKGMSSLFFLGIPSIQDSSHNNSHDSGNIFPCQQPSSWEFSFFGLLSIFYFFMDFFQSNFYLKGEAYFIARMLPLELFQVS